MLDIFSSAVLRYTKYARKKTSMANENNAGKNRMIIIKCIEKIDWIITEDYLMLALGPNISRVELNRDHHQTVPMDWLLRQLVVSTKT